VPANTDEIIAAEGVLDMVQHSDFTDIRALFLLIGNWRSLVALVIASGHSPAITSIFNRPLALKRFISRVRQRVQGVFHEIQNTGRNPDSAAVVGTLASRLLNKTVDGFCVHIAAKIASHTLRLLLRRRFGINVLTFQSQPI
jgi:hypothetical protein